MGVHQVHDSLLRHLIQDFLAQATTDQETILFAQ
ncbi:hypothetical protein A2U01_0092116, partial [Trifolium medium]|nr:hypothetical protein [Trifolium medium]